jgi:hypothetical protein
MKRGKEVCVDWVVVQVRRIKVLSGRWAAVGAWRGGMTEDCVEDFTS